MRKSFRLRLALSSALLAGLALAGFAAIAWWQMRTAKIGALDREIRDQAERELSRPWPAEHWMRHEHNMGRAFGARAPEQALLLMQGREGEAYRSGHWPPALDPDALPWPAGNDPEPADFDIPPPPPPLPDGRMPPFPPPPRQRLPAFAAQTVDLAGRGWRFGLAAGPLGRLAIGVDLAVVEAEMAELRNAFLLAAPLALGLIGLGAWFLSGRALSPLRRLTSTMEAVTAKGLDQRIALGDEDTEFRQLIEVFNRMLERLERSFLQASRFSADAAHELKTPLAILQGQIERAIAQCEDGSPVQARLGSILDEVQRLGTISRKLLLLSLADAGRLRLRTARLNLSAILEELLEDAQMLAPELDVAGRIEPGLLVEADAELLKQVLHNLLSNAIKYNTSGGWIRIAALRRAGRVEIGVANASAGIPAAARGRIFERFYRADPAHSRQVEGVGLGLSLSREIVRAHGGDLALAESGEREARFVVYLPIPGNGERHRNQTGADGKPPAPVTKRQA
jgi:signal transduction histidine kinase